MMTPVSQPASQPATQLASLASERGSERALRAIEPAGHLLRFCCFAGRFSMGAAASRGAGRAASTACLPCKRRRAIIVMLSLDSKGGLVVQNLPELSQQ